MEPEVKIAAKPLLFRMGRIGALVLVLVVLLMSSHPARVPALMLVVPFMLMFAVLYFVTLEVVMFLQSDEDTAVIGSRIHRPRLLAALLAGFPVILLVLQSIMELNRWDVIIALAILVLAYVFISRGAFPTLR
jgi:hypothetical protein